MVFGSNFQGIFFKYDISPIAINLYERYTSFGHFVTRVFAVVGGMWVSSTWYIRK